MITFSRSRVMRAVKGRGNKSTEIAIATLLRKNKIKGWRRHINIPGKPDFAFPRKKVAIFVDGCFWHGCKCKKIPKQNRLYWSRKIKRNIERDREVGKVLRKEGWKVIRIKEHQLKKPDMVMKRLHS